MTATDNAFIKIYQHEAQTKTPRPKMAGATSAARRGLKVAAGNAPASTVTTAEMVERTHASAPVEAVVKARLGVRVEPRPDLAERSADADREEGGSGLLWRDEPHAETPAPHLDADRFRSESATEPVSEVVTPAFRAAWEVDSFRWPAICDDLQRDWSAPLTSIVRSVVRQAWRGGNVVSVTQFGRAEGATTLALCLARVAAAFHIRVILVDGNPQNPDIGPSLGLRYDGGWESTDSEHALEESAIGSIEDRLVVLPLAQTEQPSLIDDPAGRRSVLERLADAFELVVLDAGPVFVAAHRWFSQPCVGKIGSALIVRDVRRTDTAQLDDVCCRLRGAGVANMSVVENFQFG